MSEVSEAQLQAKARSTRLAQAFAALFGQEKKRTAEQKLVIEHLTICAGDDGNSYRFNEAKDGVALIAAGIHRDGAKSLLRVIERQLAIAANLHVEKPPKPVSKRQ
jgi:hypothetical protein